MRSKVGADADCCCLGQSAKIKMRRMIQIQAIDFRRKNYSLFEYFVVSNSLLHFDDNTNGYVEG